jgi:hypothetical protein
MCSVDDLRRRRAGRVDALSGRRLHVAQDVEEVLRRAEEIQTQDLYTLRLLT